MSGLGSTENNANLYGMAYPVPGWDTPDVPSEATAEAKPAPSNDDILFVGMNASGKDELRALQSNAPKADWANVTA